MSIIRYLRQVLAQRSFGSPHHHPEADAQLGSSTTAFRDRRSRTLDAGVLEADVTPLASTSWRPARARAALGLRSSGVGFAASPASSAAMRREAVSRKAPVGIPFGVLDDLAAGGLGVLRVTPELHRLGVGEEAWPLACVEQHRVVGDTALSASCVGKPSTFGVGTEVHFSWCQPRPSDPLARLGGLRGLGHHLDDLVPALVTSIRSSAASRLADAHEVAVALDEAGDDELPLRSIVSVFGPSTRSAGSAGAWPGFQTATPAATTAATNADDDDDSLRMAASSPPGRIGSEGRMLRPNCPRSASAYRSRFQTHPANL
jgi:hypothetical protein